MRELSQTVRQANLIDARSRSSMREPNMPSLARVLEIVSPRGGMDATVTGCARIVGAPQAGRDSDIGTHDVCPMTGTADCPSSQSEIDKCGSC